MFDYFTTKSKRSKASQEASKFDSMVEKAKRNKCSTNDGKSSTRIVNIFCSILCITSYFISISYFLNKHKMC